MKNKLAHKYTAKCPKCEYTSRIPEFEGVILNNKNSVHSKTCPKHRLELVRVIYELKNSKSNSVKMQKFQEGVKEAKRNFANKLKNDTEFKALQDLIKKK